jgi:hypothetical protein
MFLSPLPNLTEKKIQPVVVCMAKLMHRTHGQLVLVRTPCIRMKSVKEMRFVILC